MAIDPGSYVLLSGTNTLGAGVMLADAGEFGILGGASLTEAAPGVVSGSVATIDGAGSTWNAAGGLVAGDRATGGIEVSGEGSLAAAGLVLGASAGGNGTLSVTGTGSAATVVGQVNIGQAGAGTLTVTNDGTAITGGSTSQPRQGIDAGLSDGSSGAISVTGSQSLLSNTGEFVVGDSGVAILTVSAGGTVITTPGAVSGLAGLVIGNTGSADGSSVRISGDGSRLTVAGLLDVGAAGSGVVQISNGATVTAGSLDAAGSAAAVGEISLSGAGTELSVTDDATVADDGTGVLSVLAGAIFAATNLTIGAQGDSSGALVVSGDGSVVQLSGALNIGTALGIGDLTVGPGAAVHASVVNLQGQVVLEGGLLDPTVQLINQGQTAGGFGTIAAGDIVDEGVIQAGGNKASQKLLLVVGTVLGGGTLTANGAQPGSNPVGVLQINAGGTMELTGPVINDATTTFTDNLTPTGTYTVNNSVVDVTFADAAGVLKLDDIAGFGGTITTHQAGDSFVITGGTLSNPNVVNGNTLTFADSGAGADAGGIDSIIFSSPINATGFNIVSGNTVQVACFAEGTRIETVNGPVAVEALLVGDRVVTAEDGRGEPVVWVGRRAVNCARHPNPETVWPVRVRAGAFGPGRPARDLYLSPDHAVFVNDVLVPVKLLVNGTSIAQVKQDRVTYFHVELPRHAMILAEGLSVESYLETGDRADFDHDRVLRLHPDFGGRLRPDMAMLWETKGAAPLVMTGPELAATRSLIANIATRRGVRSMNSSSRSS